MWISLKTAFERPYTYAELREDSDGLIVQPPLPGNLSDGLATFRGKSGESLLDYWRRLFENDLRTITSEPTWTAQRAALIRVWLREDRWRALYTVVKDARFPQSWAHLVEGNPIGDADEADRESLLFQRFLIGLATWGSLMVLGERRFGMDDLKRKECQVYFLLQQEIFKVDVSVMDFAFSLVNSSREAAALVVTGFRDEHLVPILNEQIRSLSLAEEQVIRGRLDVKRLQEAIVRIDARKAELASLVTAELTGTSTEGEPTT